MAGRHANWWETRWFAALLVVIGTVPLWWPTVPPLVDLPGHMGRYRVQLDLAGSPALQAFYTFRWQVIGNLGIDLLIVPMSAVFGLELGTKLIVMAIPALTVAGLLWIGREVHGEVQPTALFALPLAYGYPFLFGFTNFGLSMAFALLAFALWLRLGRLGRLRLRFGLFLAIGPVIWITHAFGWGTLGVLAFSAELIRQHDRRGDWMGSGLRAAVHCLALAPPILLMLLWRSGQAGGETTDWFNLPAKLLWLLMILRERWWIVDQLSLALLVGLVVAALASKRMEVSRNLGASALFLFLVFLILPRIVFGSAYADMRLAPYMLAVAVIGIRLRPGASPRLRSALALAGLLFFLGRIGGTTYTNALEWRRNASALSALQSVPLGARMVSFVGVRCTPPWAFRRNWHLPGMAIVRRHAFSNDQWSLSGAQLLTPILPVGRFARDPSQIVNDGRCGRSEWRSLDSSLAEVPRAVFTHLWLIEPPRFDRRLLARDTLLWSDGRSALYRLAPPAR